MVDNTKIRIGDILRNSSGSMWEVVTAAGFKIKLISSPNSYDQVSIGNVFDYRFTDSECFYWDLVKHKATRSNKPAWF